MLTIGGGLVLLMASVADAGCRRPAVRCHQLTATAGWGELVTETATRRWWKARGSFCRSAVCLRRGSCRRRGGNGTHAQIPLGRPPANAVQLGACDRVHAGTTTDVDRRRAAAVKRTAMLPPKAGKSIVDRRRRHSVRRILP